MRHPYLHPFLSIILNNNPNHNKNKQTNKQTGASQVDITHNVIKQRYTKQGEIIKDDDDDGTKNVQEGLKLVVPETSPGCGSCYGAGL